MLLSTALPVPPLGGEADARNRWALAGRSPGGLSAPHLCCFLPYGTFQVLPFKQLTTSNSFYQILNSNDPIPTVWSFFTPHRAFPGLSQPKSPLPSGVTQTHLAKINISNVSAKSMLPYMDVPFDPRISFPGSLSP